MVSLGGGGVFQHTCFMLNNNSSDEIKFQKRGKGYNFNTKIKSHFLLTIKEYQNVTCPIKETFKKYISF